MWKWLALVVVALVVLAGLAVLALPWLVDVPALQAWVAHAGAQAIGRPVTFARLRVTPLPLPTIRVQGLRVAEDPAFGPGPWLTVGEVRVGMRLGPLLRGRVEPTEVALSNVGLEIVQDAAGRLNLSGLGPAVVASPHPPRPGVPQPPGGPAVGLLASRLTVINAAVRFRRLGGPESSLSVGQVNLAVSPAGATLRVSGEGVAEPGGARFTITDGSVTPGNARTIGEVGLAATVDVRAPEVAALVRPILASPEAQGAARGQLRIGGTLGRPAVTGTVTLDRLTLLRESRRCGEPPRRRLTLDEVRMPLVLEPPRLASERLTGKVGGGSVSLAVRLDLDRAPVVTLTDIRVERVQAGTLLEDYLCQPWAVRGPLDLTGELSLRGPDYLAGATGSGRFTVGAGTVVGGDVTEVVERVTALAGIARTLLAPGRRPADAAPLQFEAITGSYTVAAGLVRSDDLRYQGRGFEVTAAGTYALADGRVDVAVTFTQGANQARGTIEGLPGALRVTPTSVRIREGRDLRRLLDRLVR
jgi:AsmA protein